jgi:hypothetical protein
MANKKHQIDHIPSGFSILFAQFYQFCWGFVEGLGLDYFTFESSLLALPQKTLKESIRRFTIPEIGLIPEKSCLRDSESVSGICFRDSSQ